MAGCSPYIGQASLNEFFKNKANQSLSSADFAEVKILNDAIDISIFASWEIKICEKNTGNNNSGDGCSARIPLSSFTDLSKPWLVLQDGTIGKYINTKTGFDAVLLDANGNLIDYLTVDSYAKAIDDVLAVSGSSCDLSNLTFDYDAGSPGTSDKYVSRSPDGTGNWTKTTSAADPGTSNNTNDKPPAGSGTLPALSVSNIIVNKGEDVIFTLTLSKTVAYDVSIQYQAQGGTAVPYVDATTKYDYTKPVSGTITFPANTTALTQTVTITTNATNPANNGSVLFYLYLFNQLNASLNNNYPSATINPASSLHHIEFIHDGSALTCNPESITVNACANADCSTLASTSVSVGLLPTGWIGGDNITLATGSASYELQHTTAELVTLNTSSTSPTTTNPVVCKNISGTVTTCDITFNDSGFIFNIPTQTSCVTSENITISAVQKSLTTNQCIPFFDAKTSTIKFWAAYSNPSTGTKQATLNYNGTDHLLTTTTAGTDIPITFNSFGEAQFTLTYPDAGELDLNATYTGSAAAADAGLSMSGNKKYVSKPAKLYVYSDDANAACPSADPTDPDCDTAFRKTGENFNLKIRAACSDNTVTPNFQLSGLTLNSNLIQPVGGSTANLNVNSFNFEAANNGEHIITNQTVDNVGVFTFTAVLPVAGYQGETTIGTTALNTSANIGRFTPDHFETMVTHGCSGGSTFTYSGQPFTVTAYARNQNNTTTLNYRDSFAFGVTLSDANPAGTPTGIFANNTITPASFTSTAITDGSSTGVGTTSTIQYTFTNKDTIPDTLEIRAIDVNDTNISSNGFSEDTTEIRSGRMRLENVFGPELTPLIMPLNIEYYSDNTLIADTSDDGFILNTDDTCTTYDATLGALTNYTGNLATGETTVTGAGSLAAGLASITFSAPGTGNDGSVNLLANNVSSWLTYNWNVDCDNADADDDITTGIDAGLCGPSGIASFGLYRGDDRVIYWREVF